MVMLAFVEFACLLACLLLFLLEILLKSKSQVFVEPELWALSELTAQGGWGR